MRLSKTGRHYKLTISLLPSFSFLMPRRKMFTVFAILHPALQTRIFVSL